jgi:hypothetical protein
VKDTKTPTLPTFKAPTGMRIEYGDGVGQNQSSICILIMNALQAQNFGDDEMLAFELAATARGFDTVMVINTGNDRPVDEVSVYGWSKVRQTGRGRPRRIYETF